MVQVASSRELVALRPPGTKDTSDASCAHITRSVCPCHMIQFTRSCSGWTHRMRGLPTSSRPAKAETLLQDIDETFRNLRAKRVKLNLEKCVFGRGTLACLASWCHTAGSRRTRRKSRPSKYAASSAHFHALELKQVPRKDNMAAHELSWIASSRQPAQSGTFVEKLYQPSG